MFYLVQTFMCVAMFLIGFVAGNESQADRVLVACKQHEMFKLNAEVWFCERGEVIYQRKEEDQ